MLSNAARRLAVGLIGLTTAVGSLHAQQTPTVNGLFYAPTTNGELDLVNGVPDAQRYPATPYAVSANDSKLYLSYIDGKLYVALVVNRVMNDNVFDADNTAYMNSAGWSGGNLSATRRIDSEYAEFGLTVATGEDEQSWTWKQGYAGQSDEADGGPPHLKHDRTRNTWISDTTVSGGEGDPPPGMESASSFMWNMNNYAERVAAGENTWTMPGDDTDSRTWKSP